MLGSIGAFYVAATFGNGWVFGYDWFTETPPAGVATAVGVLSQVLLVVLIAVAGAWSFGAFAALGMGEESLRGVYGRSGRRLLRDALIAVPGFVIGVLAVMSVVLGPVVVGLLATFAVGRVAGVASGSTVRRLGRGIGLGLIPTVLSVLVWFVGWVAARFPSPVTWVSGVFFVGLVSASAFSHGLVGRREHGDRDR